MILVSSMVNDGRMELGARADQMHYGVGAQGLASALEVFKRVVMIKITPDKSLIIRHQLHLGCSTVPSYENFSLSRTVFSRDAVLNSSFERPARPLPTLSAFCGTVTAAVS